LAKRRILKKELQPREKTNLTGLEKFGPGKEKGNRKTVLRASG